MYTPLDAIVYAYQEWRLKRALKNIPIEMLLSTLKTEKSEIVDRILDSGKEYMRELVMQNIKEAITLLYDDVRLKYTGEGMIDEYDPADKIYLRIKIDMTKEMILSHLKNKILKGE